MSIIKKIIGVKKGVNSDILEALGVFRGLRVTFPKRA